MQRIFIIGLLIIGLQTQARENLNKTYETALDHLISSLENHNTLEPTSFSIMVRSIKYETLKFNGNQFNALTLTEKQNYIKNLCGLEKYEKLEKLSLTYWSLAKSSESRINVIKLMTLGLFSQKFKKLLMGNCLYKDMGLQLKALCGLSLLHSEEAQQLLVYLMTSTNFPKYALPEILRSFNLSNSRYAEGVAKMLLKDKSCDADTALAIFYSLENSEKNILLRLLLDSRFRLKKDSGIGGESRLANHLLKYLKNEQISSDNRHKIQNILKEYTKSRYVAASAFKSLEQFFDIPLLWFQNEFSSELKSPSYPERKMILQRYIKNYDRLFN